MQNGFLRHTAHNQEKLEYEDHPKIKKPKQNLSIDDLLLEALYAHNDNQFRKAISVYSRILTMPMKKEVKGIILIHRGMAYFAESFFDAAMQDFNRAIEIDDHNAKAYCYRGIVYKMQKEYSKALEDLNRSVEIKPFDFDALYARAQVYYKTGRFSAARTDCIEALNIDPESRQAKNLCSILDNRLSTAAESGSDEDSESSKTA